MFKPSEATAELALRASQTLALEMQARSALKTSLEEAEGSLRTKAPDRSFGRPLPDYAQVQSVVGEQLIGLLAMLARQRACLAPGSQLQIADQGGFLPEVANNLVRQLNFSRHTPACTDALKALAADLRDWVERQPSEADLLGLKIDLEGGLRMTCQLQKPVLKPLTD